MGKINNPYFWLAAEECQAKNKKAFSELEVCSLFVVFLCSFGISGALSNWTLLQGIGHTDIEESS